jgi:LmbE family N-acetylglucosaminyl deacetylase
VFGIKYIRYARLFRLFEQIQPYLKYSFPLEEGLPGDKALVIAPHQDDEAIGCGGAIAKHTRSGKKAEVVFCTRETDGRDLEAQKASDVLGFDHIVSLSYPVETLQEQRDFPDRLFDVFEERAPDIVLVPFWLDNHVDHRAVNKALFQVAKKRTFPCMIYSYPIWFPLHPNVLIDISPVWEQKKEAILSYASQIATRDYIKISHGLGQYWAGVKGRGQVSESFYRATFSEYISLGKKIYGGRR